MGFGAELQGKSSHESLLHLQDTEIRLLENVKKSVSQRIQADRDYALALKKMVAQAHKFDGGDFVSPFLQPYVDNPNSPNDNEVLSPMFQAWNTIIEETESIVSIIQDNAERLSTQTLDKIVQLINEKRATRKLYLEERLRIDMQYNRLQEDVNRHKSEYEKAMSKVVCDRAKYEELYMKGKGGGRLDEARNRYMRSTTKLHRVHNDYTLALEEVNQHQRHYQKTALPGLLDYQQTVQQAMVTHCKEAMDDYAEATNYTNDKFARCYCQIIKKISLINPHTEYTVFVQKHKSDQLQATRFTFDKNLLDVYKGNLRANQIALDDLTEESLKQCEKKYADELSGVKQRREQKEKELKELEQELEKMSEETEEMDLTTKASFKAHERACLILHREVQELRSLEEKLQNMYNFLHGPFEDLGDSAPPAGLEFADGADSLSSRDGLPTAKSSSKIEAFKTILASKFPSGMRRPSQPTSPTVDTQHTSSIQNHSNNTTSATLPAGTGSTAGAPDYVKMGKGLDRPLTEEEWFHGVLPRDEVQRLLVDQGDYLVRESKNKKTGEPQYVLSVMFDGHKHFIIQGEEGSWRFEGDYCPTIQELILRQHESGQPVTNKSQAILYKPIVREQWELSNDNIQLQENIGRGNFGEVHRGIYIPTKQQVAVKTCRETLSEEMKKKFLQEGRILMQYNHPNIVKFIGIAAQRQPIMIVMEYVPGGALLQFLRTKGKDLTVKQQLKICCDAASGMAYLEDKNCIHRDLAARNCLVGVNNVVKISDFGMSREEETYTVKEGLTQIPIKWTAPEALNYGRYTSMCDVWSYGILMWEVFSCGSTPYSGLSNTDARNNIDTGYRMPPPEGTPEIACNIMTECWQNEPGMRPHFIDIQRDLERHLKHL